MHATRTIVVLKLNVKISSPDHPRSATTDIDEYYTGCLHKTGAWTCKDSYSPAKGIHHFSPTYEKDAEIPENLNPETPTHGTPLICVIVPTFPWNGIANAQSVQLYTSWFLILRRRFPQETPLAQLVHLAAVVVASLSGGFVHGSRGRRSLGMRPLSRLRQLVRGRCRIGVRRRGRGTGGNVAHTGICHV